MNPFLWQRSPPPGRQDARTYFANISQQVTYINILTITEEFAYIVYRK
ncbi:hypothetical protein HNQ93_002650 [Hymenobacter luteus]|uniref:Uncharacterized protein n=2 Tax=Hymenobacter TaxID=89966 RepID=A0A7W9T2J5_9BACT|nr:hypothetical protein [Hymenobacter latericoloratus]MBB6059790.1 hypothetical protein [Hymenobacter luteus]